MNPGESEPKAELDKAVLGLVLLVAVLLSYWFGWIP